MNAMDTTKMSSKGQVVIPDAVRKKLGLAAGTRFVVVGEGDVIILKTIAPPDMRQFDELIKESRQQAHRTGLHRRDVAAAIRKVRDRR